MKMEIIESDLKQLFQWIKNHDDTLKSQQALIETMVKMEDCLEKRIINIEKALFELSFVIKNRKNKS